MPLYDYRCPEGHQFERFLHLENYATQQECPSCGLAAVRQVSAPFVVSDLEGYTSPVDGRWVEGKAARREDLRRNGCVAWEPGMSEEIDRRRAKEEEKLDRQIEDTVEAQIVNMSARGRELLHSEISAGLDVVVTRNSMKGSV